LKHIESSKTVPEVPQGSNTHLGKVFAGSIINGSIGRVQKRTSGAGLTGTLAEEFAGNVLGVCGEEGSIRVSRVEKVRNRK
jgi:hypothetical protein